jgi:Flp pilus assembly CpaE family ATPase
MIVANRVTDLAASGVPRREIATALQRWGGVEASALLPFEPGPLDAGARAGATLAEVAPASPLRRSLADLARTLTSVPEPPPPRRRLFSRR